MYEMMELKREGRGDLFVSFLLGFNEFLIFEKMLGFFPNFSVIL